MFTIKRALKLNNEEATLMAKHAGFSRFVYNMGLNLRQQMYGESNLSDAKVILGIKKLLTNDIKKMPEYSWMNELSSRVYQNALINLTKAFKRFRSKVSEHPVFQKKSKEQSFTVEDCNGKCLVKASSKIKIPTLGTFKLEEPITESYISQTFHLVKEGKRWFVSFHVDAKRLPVDQPNEHIGVDLGIKSFATLSNGETFDAPKPLKQAKTKLAKLQRKAVKQVKGSKNQRKTYDKVRNLHYKVKSIRLDFLNKLTTYLAKTFKVIHIENLNVRGMMANHKLAGAIADLGFYEFRRQLNFKCEMYGSSLVLVDQWFPSTKICSSCGTKKDMPLSIRTYECSNCGLSIDRDVNASINILNWQPLA